MHNGAVNHFVYIVLAPKASKEGGSFIRFCVQVESALTMKMPIWIGPFMPRYIGSNWRGPILNTNWYRPFPFPAVTADHLEHLPPPALNLFENVHGLGTDFDSHRPFLLSWLVLVNHLITGKTPVFVYSW